MASPVIAQSGQFLVLGVIGFDDTFLHLDLLLDDTGLNNGVLGVESPVPDPAEK